MASLYAAAASDHLPAANNLFPSDFAAIAFAFLLGRGGVDFFGGARFSSLSSSLASETASSSAARASA